MQARPTFVLLVVISFACAAGTFLVAQQESKAPASDTLKELLTQRRDVLKQRLEMLEIQLKQGDSIIDPVIEARDQLLDAELQLADTKAERIAVLEKRVVNMEAMEDSIKQRFEAGMAKPDSVCAATAARLKAQIDLIKEKQ